VPVGNLVNQPSKCNGVLTMNSVAYMVRLHSLSRFSFPIGLSLFIYHTVSRLKNIDIY